MENNSNKNWFIAIGGVFLVLLILLIIPFKINKSITFFGKILPAETFTVFYDSDGRLVQKYYSNKNDSVSIKFLTFDRGDNFSIRSLFNSKTLKINDTLFEISSFNLEEQLIDKENELNNLIAYRKTLEAGDKPEKLNEIKSEIASLKVELENKERILSRADSLVKKGLISVQDYQSLETEVGIVKERIKSLESRYQYFKTGARLADIQSVDVQIESIKKEIELFKSKKDYYTIKNPFKHALKSDVFGSDTLISLFVPDEYVIVFPLLTKFVSSIHRGENYEFIATETADTLNCKINRIDKKISKINNREVVLISAFTSGSNLNFRPGQIVEFETLIGKQSLFDLIMENIN